MPGHLQLSPDVGRNMKMKLTMILIGVALGIALHISWHAATTRPVMVDGVVKFEPVPRPEVTPSYPPGTYVESRIYLRNVDANRTGTRIVGYGTLGSTSYPEAPQYPAIHIQTP